MENESKASIHLRNLRDLREKFWNLWLYGENVKCGQSENLSAGSGREVLEFMALQEISKSFTAEVTKECAKFAKLYFEALCFNEDAEFNGPVFALLLSFKIW